MEDYLDNKEFLKEKEKYSLFYRMLNNKENQFVTDHDTYILGQGDKRFAPWVWTKEGITEDKLLEVMKLLEEKYFHEQENELVCKIEFYNFLKKYYEVSKCLEMGFLRCKELNDVELATGYVDKPRYSDKTKLVKYWQDDYKEMTGEDITLEEAFEEVDKWLSGEKNIYVYKNKQGKVVSIAGYGVDFDLAKISHVYTPKEERCKGYCTTLVYYLTKEILDKGLTPVLYTDYNYEASNHTYKKVGYKDEGKLVSLKLKKKVE